MRGRRSAALDVAECGDARLEPRSSLDLGRQQTADATKPHVSEGIGVCGGNHLAVAGLELELPALADHHDREVLAAVVASLDQLAATLDGERLLGDQNHVRTAGRP